MPRREVERLADGARARRRIGEAAGEIADPREVQARLGVGGELERAARRGGLDEALQEAAVGVARPVDRRRAHDRPRKARRPDEPLGPQLARAVGLARSQRRALGLRILREVAVDHARRDERQPRGGGVPGHGGQDGGGALDDRAPRLERVGGGDARERHVGEVHDDVRGRVAQLACERRRVVGAAAAQLGARQQRLAPPRPRALGVGLATGEVGPVVVEHDDGVAALEQLVREVRTDEPPTSDQQRPSHRTGHPDIIAAVSATPVAGNLYDKYGSQHPVVRRLMASFLAALDALVAETAPATLLDVGCGEGIVTRRMAAATGARATGLDVESRRLRAIWASDASGVELRHRRRAGAAVRRRRVRSRDPRRDAAARRRIRVARWPRPRASRASG